MFRYTSTQKQIVSNEINIIYFQSIAYLFRDFLKFNFELQFDVTKNFQNNISTTAAANKQKKIDVPTSPFLHSHNNNQGRLKFYELRINPKHSYHCNENSPFGSIFNEGW